MTMKLNFYRPKLYFFVMKILYILFFYFISVFAEKNDVPFVLIEDGALIGSYKQTLEGKIYAAFEGIPYAAPPVDDLRFLPPQPASQWSGVRNATYVRSACPQPQLMNGSMNGSISGDEDCLYLNLYIPEPSFTERVNKKLRLNVLVYIHGGSYIYLTGNTAGPQYLFDYSDDIILVTINYRLGILGFMSLGDEIIPGNNGLKDQVASLKWIQKNIQHFGGSADRVTISGSSAGAASVHLHMLSTMSKGLFQNAISAGGTALLPVAISTNVTAKSLEVVHNLGCPTSDSKIILRCMQKLSFQTIALAILPYFAFGLSPATPFGPVVEPCIPDAFISTHPLYLVTESQEDSVPWLITMNKDEGLVPGVAIMNNATLMTDLSTNWISRFEPLLELSYVIPPELMNYTVTKIKEYYFEDRTIGSGNWDILVKMLTDRIFLNGIELAAKLHARKCNNKVYMYLFNYRGRHSTTELVTNTTTNFGVSQGDDSLYVIFDSVWHALENQTETDKEMTRAISNIWISFIRTGVPQRGNLQWPAVSCQQEKLTFLSIYSPSYAVIKDVAVMGTQPFWDSLSFTPFAGYNTFCYTFKSYDLSNLNESLILDIHEGQTNFSIDIK